MKIRLVVILVYYYATINTINTKGVDGVNKEQFNNLGTLEQIEYINSQLDTLSLTKVCQNIGIDRSTVRKRFKSKGWELVENRYIKTDNLTSTANTNNITNTKVNNKNNKSNDIKILEDKINSLEAQIKGIMDIINTNNTINTVDISELKKYEGSTVSRNYRINEEIQQEFKLLCNKFTSGTVYTVTDIISLALEDFINKHK
jgi:hypothetical protein